MSESIQLVPPSKKRFRAEEKLLIVEESFQAGAVVAVIARKYNVGISTLVLWRKLARNGSLTSMKTQEELVPTSEIKKLQKQVRNLERLLGKKSAQIEILKDAIEIAREKKLISRQPLPGIDDIASD